jgi:hypothetical protein
MEYGRKKFTIVQGIEPRPWKSEVRLDEERRQIWRGTHANGGNRERRLGDRGLAPEDVALRKVAIPENSNGRFPEFKS